METLTIEKDNKPTTAMKSISGSVAVLEAFIAEECGNNLWLSRRCHHAHL